MKKHTILFLAAHPSGTDRRALDQEARAIRVELERSGYRDRFALETRWAAEPLDLLRELRKLKPTVVHFSGHGHPDVGSERQPGLTPLREVLVEGTDPHSGALQHGLLFHGAGDRAQVVSTAALERTIDAAGTSVKLVVLSACYGESHAAALLAHVDCVVGISGSIRDDVARSFAIGFYGGLGERESVSAAYKQGCAAISLEGLHDADRPQLRARDGIDANQLVLAGTAATAAATSGGRIVDGAPDREPLWRRRLLLSMAVISLLLVTSQIFSVGAQRTACRVPGLRSLCAAIGIGDVPTPTEQALWEEALKDDSEDGLKIYLNQYPVGTYADEARSRLDGCRTTETLGPEKAVRLPQTVIRTRATEDEARRDALSSGNREAGSMCKPLEKTDALLSARAEPHDWKCDKTAGGFTCRFDGEIVCRVQERIKSKHCLRRSLTPGATGRPRTAERAGRSRRPAYRRDPRANSGQARRPR